MRKGLTHLIEKSQRYKKTVGPLGEAFLFSIGLLLSFWIRLGCIEERYFAQILFLIITIVPGKIVLFWYFNLYNISFRFTSLYEVIDILKASALAALLFGFISVLFRDTIILEGFPRSVIFIDFMLTFLAGAATRMAVRLYYFPHLGVVGKRKVLIVGAGIAGANLVREMQTYALSDYTPVAFVDDPDSIGSIIHGVRVVDGKEGIPAVVKNFGISDVIIAMPSASSVQLKDIMEYVRKTDVKNVKILPSLARIISGKVTLSDIRDLTVEDLLGRQPVEIEVEDIALYLKGKRIMVTGAGGSIGSELCRQIVEFEPSLLIMVDMGETELFYIDKEMREQYPNIAITSIIADVKDATRMMNILLHYSPQVVFHAAAYKHVPLMETNVREAVLNNVEGTKTIATLAMESGVEKFVFVSTDKVVNPTSVMGATKRVAENLLRCWDKEKTTFVSVRFGNVLESRGSMVPIFKEQIRKGGPVTVTHPEMQRYLMSVTEAAQLLLQAGAMGRGGEVFVLDMGKPVKVLELAKDMIRLSGLEPEKDIPIIFTGGRPGEKLFEELLTAEEGTIATRHKKVFIAKCTNNLGSNYVKNVELLIHTAKNDTGEEKLVALVKELVPTYQPESANPVRQDLRNVKG